LSLISINAAPTGLFFLPSTFLHRYRPYGTKEDLEIFKVPVSNPVRLGMQVA
jgi:hypothetical protein